MFDLFLNPPANKFKHSELDQDLLEKCYRDLVVKHHVQHDEGQIKVLGHLQQLLNNISEQSKLLEQSILSRLLSPQNHSPKSLYIYGDVGRGKSMLMDVFFDACPFESKRRVHFHAFMQEVHEFIFHWRKQSEGDPISTLATKIRQQSMLLCFDEFHVTDIADALLLARLFTQLIKKDVVFVATSNQHPDDLYKDGLQRELFLPFIRLLKNTASILELVGKEDYRLSHFKSMKTTFYHEPEGGDDFLSARFKELTNNGYVEEKKIQVKGREVIFSTVHGDILLTSFNELCGRMLGPADYLEIANEFNTLLIADIPRLTRNIRDQVRRFVTLIDTLYEQNVKLICTAKVAAEQLAIDDKDFDFTRTRSRLIEMQSEQYIHRQHLG